MIGILPGFFSFIIIFFFGLKIELDKVFKNYLINLIFLLIYDCFCYYFYFSEKINHNSILVLYIINDCLIILFLLIYFILWIIMK